VNEQQTRFPVTAESSAASEIAGCSDFFRGPGAPAPPPPIALRAGPVSGVLRGIDLAHMARGDAAITRLVYVAVRDEAWNTIPPETSEVRVDRREDAFAVSFEARHQTEDLDFAWCGRIEGDADGVVTYEMEGTAGRAFRYGRIGLCVLHLASLYEGCRYRAIGEACVSEGVFSREIVPQPLVDGVYVPAVGPFRELAVDLASGVTACFSFEGDDFELEDQRNWTDAAFKSYSTPLSRGLTHDAVAGMTLRQRVTVRCETNGTRPATSRRTKAPAVTAVELLELTGAVCPSIGAMCRELPASAEAANAVRALPLNYHRIDVDLTAVPSSSLDRLRPALSARVPLEVALTLTEATAGRAADALRALHASGPFARVLVFEADAEVASAAIVAQVRAIAGECAPGVAVGGGTDLWFAELNRNPVVADLDLLSFSITPQFHLGDEESVFETLPVQASAVEAAARLYPGPAIAVSPITLHARDAFALRAGTPEPVDPRQPSLLCAAWAAGSVAHLTATPARSLTYFELVGPRGVVPAAGGRDEGVRALVHPAYHVLFDACDRAGGAFVATASSDPARLAATACDSDGRRELCVVNLTPEPQRVRLGSFDRGTRVALRTLDAETLEDAMCQPREFRRAAGRAAVRRGAVELDLRPYAICTAHCERE
jgi:D-apionolactonase